jgi:DNA (cytosine-5)-methyltransferase 1
LGCEQAGMDVLASVEYDPICTAVHRFNFPRTEVICSDAATVTARTVRAAARKGWTAHERDDDWDGVIDVVVGGPPCQGFSLIGKRAFDDPRNQLVFSFARLVGTLKPRYFVMENVPGMTSVRAGESPDAPRLLDLLIEEFEGFGYGVLEPVVLNAYHFAVPQDRRRMILLGWRKDEAVQPSYPEPQTKGRTRRGMPATTTQGYDVGLPLCPSVWEAIGDLPDLDSFEQSALGDEVPLSDEDLAAMEAGASAYARTMCGEDDDLADLSYPRSWEQSLLTSSYRTVHAADVAERYASTVPGRPEPVSRFFRLHPNGVSSTLRAGTHYERGSFNAPRPIHPYLGRVVSVREAARLHSFPDWFRFHWTKWHGFRAVGNSLPPRLARAVVAQVVAALDTRPERPKKVLELGDRALLYLENIAAAERFGADLTRIPRNALRRRDAARSVAA